MKNSVVFLILVLSLSLNAQYISEVIEYTPAPGQFINLSPWGVPSSAHSIIGGVNGTLNLGAFGGYVIFKFDNPVENNPNNPYGVDFTIFGNPLSDWSEPATVFVMKDLNGNNLPDDTWYELAGSDYFFSSTMKNYQVTYSNPNQNFAADVAWTDNNGGSGFIYANSYYTQPYYPLVDSFPQISQNSFVYEGTKIQGNVDLSNPAFLKSYKRSFGYSDNQFRGNAPYTVPDNPYTQQVENSGGDAFDISWAVDTNGNYVDLDVIHFVKVQNSIMANAGALGEISPEITGAVDVDPDASISGLNHILVIKDLPKVITTNTFQLEVFEFFQGRLVENSSISWQCSLPDANVDENNILTVNSSGQLELTACLTTDYSIQTSVTVDVNLSVNTHNLTSNNSGISPNPATNKIILTNSSDADIKIFDVNGNIMLKLNNYQGNYIDVSNFNSGVYIVSFSKNGVVKYQKFIKF